MAIPTTSGETLTISIFPNAAPPLSNRLSSPVFTSLPIAFQQTDTVNREPLIPTTRSKVARATAESSSRVNDTLGGSHYRMERRNEDYLANCNDSCSLLNERNRPGRDTYE